MNVAPRITALAPALGPGLALALVATAVSSVASWALAEVSGAVISPLVVALVLGAVLGSLRRTPATASDGLAWTTKHVLRAGVVLLGLKLSLGQVAELGWRGVAVIAATVACTFLGTLMVGKIMGVTRLTRLYVATGFSICGAVAIAAMAGTVQPRQRVSAAPRGAGEALGGGAAGAAGVDGTADVALADEHESADALGTSLALVTIYGSLAIFVLPWLVSLLGLDDAQAGLWIGASVQEVGQVVAAAGVVSTTALAAATVAKLARVVLLAPLTAGVALVRQAGAGPQAGDRAKVAPIPLFVVGFLAAVLVRSTGVLPTGLLAVAETASNLMLTAAMFALGTGVDLRRLVTTGGRPLALGAIATMIAVGVSLAGVLLLG